MGYINYEDLIGKNIKKARLEKGWSQDKLGKKSDVANTVISSYENGSKTPGLSTVVRIAKELDVSIDSLIYGDESESFINTAPNKGRKIVNSVYVLWEQGVIYYLWHNDPYSIGIPFEGDSLRTGAYLGLRKYIDPINRLLHSLEEYASKKETFPDPDAHLESILSSVANEINSMIEKDKENEKKKEAKNKK
jgi:transcriptional regulator with XRE-family HTH domain